MNIGHYTHCKDAVYCHTCMQKSQKWNKIDRSSSRPVVMNIPKTMFAQQNTTFIASIRDVWYSLTIWQVFLAFTLCVCVRDHVHVMHMCGCMYMRMHMQVHILHVCVCSCVSRCVCMYLWIYMWIYMYVHSCHGVCVNMCVGTFFRKRSVDITANTTWAPRYRFSTTWL